jgi:tripeptide aminopeptidase
VRNAVPADAAFGGEFRSRNTETLDLLRMQVLTTMKRARKRYREATIQEELEVMFHMYNLDPNDPIVRLVTRVMGELRLAPDILPSGGGTDANAMRLNGIDCVVVGMSTNEMHTVNEYVLITDLVDTARFCERVMEAR